MKRSYKNILIISVLMTGYLVSGGQGCSKKGSGTSSSGGTGPVNEYTSDGTVPDKITLATVYGKQVLDHLVSCLGTQVPSSRSTKMYEDKQGTISVTGAVDSLSAPMLIGEISIAGEVCQDLIEQESPLSDNDRRIFLGIDFNSTTMPSDQTLRNAIRRISLSCWQKTEDDTERQILMDALNEAFSAENYSGASKDTMLFMCTSMLSSTNALIL